MRWVFHFDYDDSIGASIGAASGGIAAECVRIYLKKKKMNRITKR